MLALNTLLRPALLGAARSSRLERTISRLGPTRHVVERFVAGEKEPAVVSAAAALLKSGRYVSVDFLGEDTTDAAMATATVEAYLSLLRAYAALPVPETSGSRPLEVSLKLSAMGQALPEIGHDVALANARIICEAAAEIGVWVTIDAEDHTTTDSTLAIVKELRRDFPDLGTVLQAYLKRTEDDCRELSGPRSRIRLCKGAYQEPSTVAYTKRDDVDSSYRRCLRILMNGQGYPMVASHDPRHDLRSRRLRHRGRPDVGGLRVPDAVRHPRRGAAPPGLRGPPGPGVHALRRAVVRLLHAPPRRAPGQRALLPPLPHLPQLTHRGKSRA